MKRARAKRRARRAQAAASRAAHAARGQAPLGVFDSGIGGLTVVRHLRRLLPGRRIVYFGDTARVPYGTKSNATVHRFAVEAARFLTLFRIDHLVVACNTVSAVALHALEREFRGLPVDGVIEPGALAAVRATRRGRIGVIGTRATVASGAYEAAIRAAARREGKQVRVYATPCPLLVPLAEEGMTRTLATREVLRGYLAPLKRRGIDTLILGCTHYPPFKPALRAVLGRRVRLIDSGEATARRLARTLRGSARGQGSLECYVSDIPRQFEAIGKRFLGQPIGRVRLVEQDDLPWFERRPAPQRGG